MNDRTYWNNKHVEKMRAKIKKYDYDDDKENRIKLCECKYCHYININRIVGEAFTTTQCENCGKQMVFSNTDINTYCIECSKELDKCIHCGSEMD